MLCCFGFEWEICVLLCKELGFFIVMLFCVMVVIGMIDDEMELLVYFFIVEWGNIFMMMLFMGFFMVVLSCLLLIGKLLVWL